MHARWLFGLVFLAYLFGPTRAGAPDHRVRELVAESLLAGAGFDLRLLPLPADAPSDATARLPNGRTLAQGPVLAAVASLPFSAALRAIYPLVAPADRARRTGRLAGAFWTAGAVAVTFLALKRLASMEAALLLAPTAAFASPLWSWASRSDVPEAPAALVMATLLWVSAGRSDSSPLLGDFLDFASGALAAALLFLDPPSLLGPVLVLVFVRCSPLSARAALLSAVGGAAAALALFWLQREATGRTLPWTWNRFANFDSAVLAAYFVSPGRGLLFFAPIAVLAVAALLRGERPRRVVRGGALVGLAVLAEVACRVDPWGPHGFGPVIVTPYVPLLAAMAAGLPRTWLRVGTLLSVPVAIAHGGAVFLGGHTWDERRQVVQHSEVVWDVRDSPFTDLVMGPPRPDPASLVPADYWMLPGEQATRQGRRLPWMVYGWEEPEPPGVWASGRESWIALAVPPGQYTLTLTAAAPRRRGRGQRLEIDRPSDPPLEFTFSRGLWEYERVVIPFRSERAVTILKLRPAHTWLPGHGDVRECSVFVASLRLERASSPGMRAPSAPR